MPAIVRTMRVQFQDEAPAIGSGWRLCTVRIPDPSQPKSKWVRIMERATGAAVRVRLKDWREIGRNALEV